MNTEKLKDLRENILLTMEDLAKKINVSKSSYSLWEEGIERIPLERLILICDFFNVSLDYLLDNTTRENYSNIKKGYDKTVFIERLKIIRKEHDITQQKLASKLNISRTSIINYEKGYTMPNLDFIIFISKKYKVSADYLLGKIDKPKYFNNN